MATSQVSTSLRQQDISVASPYISRYVLPLARPEVLPVQGWRNAVKAQEVIGIARDTITSYIISTPWRIEPSNPDTGDRYDNEVQYYTDMFNSFDGGYEDHLELVLQDMLDTPLGGCTELVRDPDVPGGRVVNYQHMDAATLFPTVFKEYPLVQRVLGLSSEPVIFEPQQINRIGWSPRPEIRQKGWYMAPPERIYLALQMLVQGDQYYWKLLQDTPEMGILDLGDMDRQSAEDWLKAWKDLLLGTDPFKIPVLYEHNSDIKYVPFNRPPSDIIYDKVTMMRAAFAVAGYGITLQDAGLLSEGTSLAASIRQERRTEKTGFARVRTKVTRYWKTMLPSYLKFTFIERDDERLVAKGRARLANSMALRNLTEAGILLPEDAQQQLVADGLITVPVSQVGQDQGTQIIEPSRLVSQQLGSPVPASQGGMGEVKRSVSKDDVRSYLDMFGLNDPMFQDDLTFDLLGFDLNSLLGGVLDPEPKE